MPEPLSKRAQEVLELFKKGWMCRSLYAENTSRHVTVYDSGVENATVKTTKEVIRSLIEHKHLKQIDKPEQPKPLVVGGRKYPARVEKVYVYAQPGEVDAANQKAQDDKQAWQDQQRAAKQAKRDVIITDIIKCTRENPNDAQLRAAIDVILERALGLFANAEI